MWLHRRLIRSSLSAGASVQCDLEPNTGSIGNGVTDDVDKMLGSDPEFAQVVLERRARWIDSMEHESTELETEADAGFARLTEGQDDG